MLHEWRIVMQEQRIGVGAGHIPGDTPKMELVTRPCGHIGMTIRANHHGMVEFMAGHRFHADCFIRCDPPLHRNLNPTRGMGALISIGEYAMLSIC